MDSGDCEEVGRSFACQKYKEASKGKQRKEFVSKGTIRLYSGFKLD